MRLKPASKVIDVHGHWGSWFFAMDIGSVEENLRLMDLYGIDLQIVSASEAVVYDAPGGNAKLAAVLEKEPRLRGYVVINPNNVEQSAADLDRYLADPRWCGVKIHTSYPGRSIDSPQMKETFDLLDQHSATVLIHTWGPDVLTLAELVRSTSRVRAIAGHAGAFSWDLAVQAAARCDRVYLEPSCSMTMTARIRHLYAGVDHRRLLFGTDATLIDPAVAIGLFAAAELSEPSRELIFWENAVKLFGLHSWADEQGDPL